MRERAARSRAVLEIRPRQPRGTYIAVRVGLPGAAHGGEHEEYEKLITVGKARRRNEEKAQ